MKFALIFMSTVTILSGCASSSSGPLRAGQDTYTINTSASLGKGGASAAKQIAYNEANAECTSHRQIIDATEETVTLPSLFNGMYIFDLKFKCVDAPKK